MAKKLTNIDEVLSHAQETGRKARELIDRAQSLHIAVEAAHERAEVLHRQIRQKKSEAKEMREAAHKGKR